ncbi:MAG: hypothetical protein R6X32_01625, partial [Chloroflexota bacterium]
MKHLNVLVESGLVNVKREGRQRWNFLDEGLLQQVQAIELENNGSAVSFLGEETAVYSNGSTPTQITLQKSLAVPRAALFVALTADIGHWWPGTRAAQTETARIIMETTLNGRFYELFGADSLRVADSHSDAHGTLHGTITHYDPPHELHLVGPFNLIDSLAYSLVRLRLTVDSDRPGHTLLQLEQQLISPATPQQTADYRTCWQDLFSNHLQPYILE